MWRSKKFIIALATALTLVIITGGIVLAQTGSGTDNQAKDAMWNKICDIYKQNTGVTIDPQELQKAFEQARPPMKHETLDERLNSLVTEGKITQAQADQYNAWLQSKPDMSQYNQQLKDWEKTRPAPPDAFKQWLDSRPNIPNLGPMGGEFHGGHGPQPPK
jgi:hypothetical protein